MLIKLAFYLCQRAITHPIAPLFDARVGELKPLTVSALKRIFALSDKDQDGYLNDEELSILQKRSFGKAINVQELDFIKQTLLNLSSPHQEYENYSLYVTGKGLTRDGFFVLNKLYSEKGRHETTWGILRAFHYTDSLSINDKVLYPKMDIPDTASVELSPLGYRFLVELFLMFDKDNDGGLNEEELDFLFQTTPGIPKLALDRNKFSFFDRCEQSGIRHTSGLVSSVEHDDIFGLQNYYRVPRIFRYRKRRETRSAGNQTQENKETQWKALSSTCD